MILIWKALVEVILNWLEKPKCTRCELLEEELHYERMQKEKLQSIIFVNARLTSEETVEVEPEFKSVARRVSLRDAIKRKQNKVTQERQQEKVEIATDKIKTEAEKIFEESLKSAS